MRDIVAKLRTTTIVHNNEDGCHLVAYRNMDGEEAAIEIERLRMALERAACIAEEHWTDWPREEIAAAIRELIHYTPKK